MCFRDFYKFEEIQLLVYFLFLYSLRTTPVSLLTPEDVRGVVLDYDTVVSGFEHQSRCYVHFRSNNLGKG